MESYDRLPRGSTYNCFTKLQIYVLFFIYQIINHSGHLFYNI